MKAVSRTARTQSEWKISMRPRFCTSIDGFKLALRNHSAGSPSANKQALRLDRELRQQLSVPNWRKETANTMHAWNAI